MKKKTINISLYIIFPVIVSGLSLLSIVVTYNIIDYSQMAGKNAAVVLLIWIVFITLTAFACGFFVLKFVLKPVEQFVEKAKENPAIAPILNDTGISRKDEIKYITNVFNQVTDALSKVDSRHLFPEFDCDSKSMRSVLNLILKVSATDSTVLIQGESGTGKELVATSIYEHSNRKGRPFIKLNCVAIPDELLESELFGHEKGAFTGATSRKYGKFELANGGTIFLDEIGDMPLSLQGKLLRVLQEKEVDVVGGSKPVKVDVRIIAATNKDLETMVKEGHFREDLYYRLNVLLIHLPPLRERREDIPLLVENKLKNMGDHYHISEEVVSMLRKYNWPGNIRELLNTVERAAVLSETGMIEAHHLPSYLSVREAIEGPHFVSILDSETTLDEKLREIEINIITDALKRTGGVQVTAAKLLGINQRSLWHRAKKYGIDITKFKRSPNSVD